MSADIKTIKAQRCLFTGTVNGTYLSPLKEDLKKKKLTSFIRKTKDMKLFAFLQIDLLFAGNHVFNGINNYENVGMSFSLYFILHTSCVCVIFQ